MYKNILIATDGSELSERAVESGIGLARTLGAKVTAVTVTVPITAYMTSEAAVMMDAEVYEERTAAMAARCLEHVADLAGREGVDHTEVRAESNIIYQGIIDAAAKHGCDLIVMASHGHTGISALVLGSETTKVLTHTKIPVLVCR